MTNQPDNVLATGERVESILDSLRTGGDPRAADAAEELVRLLVGLYGAGLRQMMALITDAGVVGEAILDHLANDPLVESLLLVHDLHPVDIDTRIQRALDRVRPHLGSYAKGLQYQGVDASGTVHVRLLGGHGCRSSRAGAHEAIERAVRDAAPETTGVLVESEVDEPARGPQLLQIGRR